MRQPFLQGKPLLVEVVTWPPEVERDLPTGLFFISTEDLNDLIQPALVM